MNPVHRISVLSRISGYSLPGQRLMLQRRFVSDRVRSVLGGKDTHTSRIKTASDNQKYLRGGVCAMLSVWMISFCAVWVAVPLYDMYCKSTGSSGSTSITAHKAYEAPPTDPHVSNRIFRVDFAGTVRRSLKWQFYPEQRSIRVAPGETALAFFRAKNETDRPIIGVSVYHMIPPEAGIYFNKIQCFCFDEQLLGPGEEVDMPVFFFIDPAIVDDPRFDEVGDIVLTYIFSESDSLIPDGYEHLTTEVELKKIDRPTDLLPPKMPSPRPTLSAEL